VTVLKLQLSGSIARDLNSLNFLLNFFLLISFDLDNLQKSTALPLLTF